MIEVTKPVFPEPGVYQNIPFHDYLAAPCFSSSTANALRTVSPYKMQNRPDKDTSAKRRGSLLHVLALEPERAAAEIKICPPAPQNTNAGKATFVEWMEEITGPATRHPPSKLAEGKKMDFYIKHLTPRLEGIEWYPEADFLVAKEMLAALHQRADIRGFLEDPGDTETSIVHLIDGYPVKIRPDKTPHEYASLLDVKKTRDISLPAFKRSMITFGHDIQSYVYKRVMDEITGEDYRFLWICIEEEPPHDCVMYEAGQEDLEWGEKKFIEAFDIWKRCIDADFWPGAGWDWDTGRYVIQTTDSTL